MDKFAEWLHDEVHSDDGLTWDEFKAKITELAAKHDCTPTAEDWKHIKLVFDEIDTDGSGSITPSEFEAVCDQEWSSPSHDDHDQEKLQL